MTLGDGHTARFWDDRWIDGRSIREIAPALYACIPKRRRQARSVADGLRDNSWARVIHGVVGVQEVGEYLQLWLRVTGTILSDEPDRLLWKWTASGEYTARSAYKATFHGSTPSPSWKHTWKFWAPPRVKFFTWLALQDRCWTAARLARRGLQHHPRCLLCDQDPEDMRHLLIECPFSKQTWHETLSWLRMTCRIPSNNDATLTNWLEEALQATPKPLRKGLGTAALLIPWMIWKHRNDCVFDRAQPCIHRLMAKIKEEATLWARAGALGLRVVLPPDWDVH